MNDEKEHVSRNFLCPFFAVYLLRELPLGIGQLAEAWARVFLILVRSSHGDFRVGRLFSKLQTQRRWRKSIELGVLERKDHLLSLPSCFLPFSRDVRVYSKLISFFGVPY